MGHAPENTIASVQKALELRASCIEIDVYLVDGQLVVFHDQRLDRTTNGSGFIGTHTFDALRTLDAGEGEQIPTLTEVCQAVDAQMGINIELKGPGTAIAVVGLVAAQVQKGWDKALFLVSSFDHSALGKVKQLDPDIQLGVLLSREGLADGIGLAARLGAYSIHPDAESVSLQWVEQAHAVGLKIFAYTVNRTDQIHKMGQLGVDGVFTNFPDRIVDELGRDRQLGWP